MVVVHLPIACHYRVFFIYFSNAFNAGRAFPLNNSNDAPPPVDTWVISFISPNFSNAAAVSPPPQLPLPRMQHNLLGVLPFLEFHSHMLLIQIHPLDHSIILFQNYLKFIKSVTESGPISNPIIFDGICQ